MIANGFVNGEKIEDIYPPCAHTTVSETCAARMFCKYEKPCKMIGATQRKCSAYNYYMSVETYRDQFKEKK